MSTTAPSRRRRLSLLGVAAGLAAVTVAVAAFASSRHASPPSTAPEAPAQAAAAQFAGIPERNGVLGDSAAKVTVTEYVDLQCPVCAAASQTTIPPLVRDYVRTGKVKLQARTLHFLGPDSERAARVAAGAESQGRLWPFMEAFYAQQGTENSGYVTDGFLTSVAQAAGVDARAAIAQAGSSFADGRLARADADAAAARVTGTPTFTVATGTGPARVVDAASLLGILARETAR
jgi:protein-disulfide isomerase